MRLPPFKLERYFARWEFSARYLLGCSDIQGWSMSDLLQLADPECLRLWDSLQLGYTESRGHPLVREAIASLYRGLESEDILCLAGAQEGIWLAFQTLLQAGDQVLAMWPGYQSLYTVVEALGAQVERFTLRAEHGWSTLGLAERVGPEHALVVVNSPHNPTGAVVGEDTLGRVLATGVRVFSDEVYRGLEPGPARPAAACELDSRALSLGVMSKAYGLAGLRIGWLACRDRALLAQIAAAKDYTTICNSAPAEILALIALRNQEVVLERSRTLVAENLALLEQFMRAHRERLDWVPPEAGCLAFPWVRGQATADPLTQELLESYDTLVLPGSLFDMPGAHLRLGFGRTDFPQALAQFDAYLRGGPGGPVTTC